MNFKKLSVSVMVSLLLPMTSAASDNDEIREINLPMTAIGRVLQSSLPTIYDDKAFADPKNKEDIKERLAQLQLLFNQVEPHLKRRSVTFKVSSDVLNSQIEKAQKAFDRQEYHLAQHILKGIPSVCMSCHIQDRQGHKLFGHVDEKTFHDAFSKAEFSFVTRDYKMAMQEYDAYLKDPISAQSPSKQLTALERMLVLYSEVYKEPEVIHRYLKKYQNLNTIDKSLKPKIKAWLSGLEEYIHDSGVSQDGVDYNKLDEYMGRHYTQMENAWVPNLTDEKDKVFYVMLRASLHEYLNQTASEQEIPALLYWLAVCDKTLEYNFYFSLSDWYLKECIKGYASDPYAQKCYQAYEDYVTFSYTGSRGTQLPKDVQQELNDLKARLPSSSEHG